jgi:uncharacterized membrane protein
LKPPDQWFSHGQWEPFEILGWLVLGGVIIAILVLQPLVWKIAVGVVLGELGLMGLTRAFGRYHEFRAGLKAALTFGVQKQDQA